MANESSSNGISFFGLLGIAFIVLKLCGVIGWSWWWVTCPLWAGAALIVVGLILYVLGALLKEAYRENTRRNPKVDQQKSKWGKRLEEIRREQIKKREANAQNN